jgi:hypothetical protein
VCCFQLRQEYATLANGHHLQCYECVWDERIYNIFPQQEQQNIEKNFPEGTKPGARQRTTYHPSDYKLITSSERLQADYLGKFKKKHLSSLDNLSQKKNLHKENEEDAKNMFVRTEKRSATVQIVSNFCVLNMSIYFAMSA